MELQCVAKVLLGYRMLRLIDTIHQPASATATRLLQNSDVEEPQCSDGVCTLNGWKPEKH